MVRAWGSGGVRIVVMGVAGAGKTTLARALADRLAWPFAEGDDLHPAANVAKMAAGEPLDDADRDPWIAAVADRLERWAAAGECGIVSCSALKAAYRRRLLAGAGASGLVYLHAAPELAQARVAVREGHFMPSALVRSQIRTLEEPAAEEAALWLSAGDRLDAQVDAVLRRFRLPSPTA